MLISWREDLVRNYITRAITLSRVIGLAYMGVRSDARLAETIILIRKYLYLYTNFRIVMAARPPAVAAGRRPVCFWS